MHRHRKMFFFLGCGGASYGRGWMGFRARLRDQDLFATRGAIDFCASACRFHGEFLVAMGTIKNDIHNCSLSLLVQVLMLRSHHNFFAREMPVKSCHSIVFSKAL